MIDIHFIAKNQHTNPITVWDVKTVDGGMLVGTLEARGDVMVFDDAVGITVVFQSFQDALVGIDEMFSPEFVN